MAASGRISFGFAFAGHKVVFLADIRIGSY
jgi:hypothetical protein